MKKILIIPFLFSICYGQLVTNKGYIVDTATFKAGLLGGKVDTGDVVKFNLSGIGDNDLIKWDFANDRFTFFTPNYLDKSDSTIYYTKFRSDTSHTNIYTSLAGKLSTSTAASTYLPLSGGTMTGNLLATDNTYDLGASGATRFRTGYFGTSVISPLFNGLAITNNGTNTLNITAGKTLAIINSLQFSGVDATAFVLPSASTTLAGLGTTQTFSAVNTFSSSPVFSSGFQTNATSTNSNILTGGTGLSSSANSKYLLGGASANFRVGIAGGTSTVATAGTHVSALLVGINDFTEATSGTHAIASGLTVLKQTFTNGTATTTDFQNVYIDDAPTGGTNNWSLNAGVSNFRGTITGTSISLSGNLTAVGNITGATVTTSGGSYFQWSGRSLMYSPSDGIIRIADNAGTTFNRLQFGGTTSSFPSLKRSGTGLQVRLADDSGDGALSAATFNKVTLTAPATASTLTVVDGTTITLPDTTSTVVRSPRTIQNGVDDTTTLTVSKPTTGLRIWGSANKKYKLHGEFRVSCSGAGGVKFSVEGPSGAAIVWGSWIGTATVAGTPQYFTTPSIGQPSGTAFVRGALSGQPVAFTVYLTTSATAGDIYIGFISGTLGQTSTILSASTLELTEVL